MNFPLRAPKLRSRDLSIRFNDGTLALDTINLEIDSGSFVAILGPSGCGKSTLLRAMAGLLPPTSGDVQGGAKAGDTSGASAFVFQQANLLPWRTVAGNIALPLELNNQVLETASLTHTLQQVGLGDVSHQYPHTLSGGMAMRVSLARALVTQPNLLFMDEPFGALDDMTRHSLGKLILELWDDAKWTCLFVTHNIYEAALLANRIVVLSKAPGKVVADLPCPWKGLPFSKRRSDPRFSQRVDEIISIMGHGEATPS